MLYPLSYRGGAEREWKLTRSHRQRVPIVDGCSAIRADRDPANC